MPHLGCPLSKSNDALCHEQQRLDLLGRTGLLDTEASQSFDRITRLAARLFGVPIALVSFVDEDRQWFKSRFGLDVSQTGRDVSFCSHAIGQAEVMVVEDTMLDPRFQSNPLVVGEPRIRFYAGAPLRLDSGHALGSLCIIDHVPRTMSAEDRARLADLAALVMSQIDLHQRSGLVDSVTRLPNRAQMSDDLDGLCATRPGESRGLMLIDVMAHAQLQSAVRALGIKPLEVALREIVRMLRARLGPHVPLYHVGETRFSFLLPGDDRAAREDWAVRLLEDMRKPFSHGGITVELDVHAGLTEFRLLRGETEDALRQATSAMHQAASSGLTWRWHDAGFDRANRRAYWLLRDVPTGLRSGQFRLVYQPKFNLRLGRFSGAEALARWSHPQLGEVPPASFVPLVESTALIHEFTRWVLDTALSQLRAWQAQGLDLTVAVNVSSRNLDDPTFVDHVRQACETHQVSPLHLHIECTEHSMVTSEATHDALIALRDMGAQVSLDDFGMGFSNLSCLRSLPVQLLKIDQSLVRPIDTEPRALQLVRSLIDLGHSLGYRMLGEGVETQAVYDLLVDAGCDAIQGYFLSHPLAAQDVPAFLAQAASPAG